MASLIKRIAAVPWLAEVITLLGGILFLSQAIKFASTQISILDEGAYLYKGYLFATGQTTPFQDYGAWGNHMPFSFLIPGYVQAIFGPGLRTGRYFSIALALIMLLGLWILSKRLGGRWWAMAAVWVVALTPIYSRIYSSAYSQVLIVCLFIWILVLTMNEKLIPWQIYLGSALAGISVLTRLNMILVLPLLLGFIFWQHGKRVGLLASATAILTLIIGHALFWPGILRLWASWLPTSLTPFLDAWRVIDTGIGVWDPKIPFDRRVLSFWWGVRSNFIALVGIFGLGILAIQPKSWQNEFYRRSAVYLTLQLVLLFAAHAWASLGKNYCVFCFQVYLTFFAPIALLIIIIIFRGWKGEGLNWYAIYAGVLILLISVGISDNIHLEIVRAVNNFNRLLRRKHIIASKMKLWEFLELKTGLPYETTSVLVPILLGLAFGLLVLLITWIIYRRIQSKQRTGINFGLLAIGVLLIIGLMLSPTKLLGNNYQDNDCGEDVILAHETAGRYLAGVIPPGSSVYWEGTPSVVQMLYVPGVSLYLPQIDYEYTYHLGGDPQELLKVGLWNEELAEKWKQEADFLIIAEQNYNLEWDVFIEPDQFEELAMSPSVDPCQEGSRLRIFRRKVIN
ncbi:MAG: ArnT family glycosyltransferase [Anaerolineales bacterium]